MTILEAKWPRELPNAGTLNENKHNHGKWMAGSLHMPLKAERSSATFHLPPSYHTRMD
jgi:hypothetical protein